MKIVLGSGSKEKLEIMRRSVERELAFVDVRGVNVNSGVSDQMLSIEEVAESAVNRAKGALEKSPKADLGVGMEAGLESIGGIYNLVCVAAFWDGEKLITGQSGHLPLPKKVSDEVKKGREFGKLIREYQKTAPPEESERINQLISSELSFASAIKATLPQLRQRYGILTLPQISQLLQYSTSPQHLPAKLLRLASILTGFYFTFGSILMFVSMLKSRPDVFIQVNAVIPLSLLLILISLGLYLSMPRIKRSEETSRSLLMIGGAVFLLLITNLYIFSIYLSSVTTLKYILQAFGATSTAIINIVGIVVIALFGYLLSKLGRESMPSMATIAYIIVGSIGIVESFVLVGGIGTALITFPILAVGILWCIGIWNLANELEEVANPRESDVIAFQKMDKA